MTASKPRRRRSTWPRPGARAVALSAVSMALCLGIAGNAAADYEARTYYEPGTDNELEYYLYVPDDYDPSQTYPIMLFLHAAGGDHPEDRTRSESWTAQFIEDGKDQRYPSFFLVPVSKTNSSGWGDGRSDADKFEGRLAVDLLKQYVESDEFNIDPERLYVSGPSMGGRGTWDMIEKNPGLFAAAVPVAAPGLDDYAAVVNENIWAINGENDSTVSDNRETIEGIRDAGGNPIYTEIENTGHSSWRGVYPSEEFLAWVYAQRRGVPWWCVTDVPVARAEGGDVADLTPGQTVVTGPMGPNDADPADCAPSGTGGAGTGGAGTGGAGTGGAGSSGDAAAGGSPAGGAFGGTGGAGSGGAAVAGGSPAGGAFDGPDPGVGGSTGDETGAGCTYTPRSAPPHAAWLLMLLLLYPLRRKVR